MLELHCCTFRYRLPSLNSRTRKASARISVKLQSHWNAGWHAFAVESFRNRFEFDGELAAAVLFVGMHAPFEWQRFLLLLHHARRHSLLCDVYLLFGCGL